MQVWTIPSVGTDIR